MSPSVPIQPPLGTSGHCPSAREMAGTRQVCYRQGWGCHIPGITPLCPLGCQDFWEPGSAVRARMEPCDKLAVSPAGTARGWAALGRPGKGGDVGQCPAGQCGAHGAQSQLLPANSWRSARMKARPTTWAPTRMICARYLACGDTLLSQPPRLLCLSPPHGPRTALAVSPLPILWGCALTPSDFCHGCTWPCPPFLCPCPPSGPCDTFPRSVP